MKPFFFIIMVFAVLQVYAQKNDNNNNNNNNPADKMITTSISSASVSKWFEIIEKNGVILSYNPSVIDLSQICRVETGQIKIGKLLKSILSDYKLKLIFVEPRKIILQAEKKKRYVIVGKIKEEGSSEKLYGATLIFTDKKKRKILAVSCNNGMYSLSLPEGDYQVEISYIGYNVLERKICLDKDLFLDFELKSHPFEMEEVVIKSRTFPAFLGETSPADLLSFTSSDLFAQIRILPGVMARSANGEFQVNGGNNDENLMLIDDIPVYHSNHLNSMLPSFNGDAIKSVGFYKSLFPARFEGRLSSVTDVRLKDGNKTRHSQTFSWDMSAASLMLEGPIIKNKLSYMASARRSWLEFFDKLLANQNRRNYSYYDFNLKLAYDINSKTSLKFIAYNAINKYFEPSLESKKPVLTWDNELYACKINTVFGKKLFNTTSLAYTSYSNKAEMLIFDLSEIDPSKDIAEQICIDNFTPNEQYVNQSCDTEFISSGIREVSLFSEFNYNVANMYNAVWGINGSFKQFSIAKIADGQENTSQPIIKVSFFYDNQIRITNKLLGQLGVNYVAYMPTKCNNYYSNQPRFSLKYTLDGRNLFYAGFSRMVQFYHYLRINIFTSPTDFRMPSIARYKPSTSNQTDVGWKYFLPSGLVESSLFYKKREHIIALKPGSLPWSADWKETIMIGNGQSYGFRFFMCNKWQKFAFQLSYAYTRSLEWYPHNIVSGKISSLSDIPHALNTAATYNLTKRSAISVVGVLKSGRIIGNADDVITLTKDEFRRLRYPSNYRLDASYSFSKQFKKSGTKLLMRVGMCNIIGNPRPEDLMDFYTVAYQRHCLPYWSFSIKF